MRTNMYVYALCTMCCVFSILRLARVRLVLIEGSVWEVNNFLSHLDGSCWQLSLYQPVVQGSKKPFEWLGWLISSNRIFPAVSEKSSFACKKTRANVFLHIYL